MDPPGPVKPSIPRQHLDYSILRVFDPESPNEAISEFFTQKNSKLINVYCFKLLNFEIVCYTAIANTVFYNWTWDV